MAIKVYTTRDEFAADSKPTTESLAGVILDGNVPVRNGVMVEVKVPEEGDIVVYDQYKTVHFIKCDTFNAAMMPSNWTSIGVVIKRRGNKVLGVNKVNNATRKWADVHRWVVTGANMTDNTEHTATVTCQGTQIGTDFTYQCETIAEFVAAFNAYMVSKSSTVAHMYVEGTTVYLIWNAYTANPSTWSISDLTLTAAVGTEIPAISTVIRNNGVSSTYAGANFPRFYEYYSVSGADAPSTPVTELTKMIYKKTAFESENCAYLYELYNGDYEAYLRGHMARQQCPKGVMGNAYRDGYANTKKLGDVKYLLQTAAAAGVVDVNQATSAQIGWLYPAAHYALREVKYDGVKGFDSGSFFMMSAYDACDVFENITYGLSGVTRANSDPVNRSLLAIGGTAISVIDYTFVLNKVTSGVNHVWQLNYIHDYPPPSDRACTFQQYNPLSNTRVSTILPIFEYEMPDA